MFEFTPEARQELVEQMLWYDDQQPGLGKRFVDTIGATLDIIQQRPESAPSFGDEGKRKRIVLKPFDRFSIVYEHKAYTILIVRVWAAARDPKGLAG